MTTERAREYFRMECDKRSIGAYDTFIIDEIDYHISFAIRQFYERRLSGFTKDGTSFEEWQKRTEDLRPVLVRYSYPMTKDLDKRGCKYAHVTLPQGDDLWHIMSEEVRFDKTGKHDSSQSSIYCDVYESTTENITARINNSLGDHIYYKGKIRPLRLFTFKDGSNEDGSRSMVAEIYYIDEEDVLSNKVFYTIEYIKTPSAFGVESPDYNNEEDGTKKIFQVPEYAWDDVISIAVSHALENIGSPRVGTYTQEQQLIQ